MLKDVRHLVEAGFAVHRLHPRSKRPIGEDWAAKPVLTFAKLSNAYRDGENLGVRLGEFSKVGGGFLHVFDLDIRAPARAAVARAKLADMLPEYETLPSVISGSGGSSRHFYVITDRPFPSKKLVHSPEKITGDDGKPHWAWEIEFFGTGKQVALPPSIHPDTGKPYRWERPVNTEDLEIGVGPFISVERIAALLGDEGQIEYDDEDERHAPLGLSDDEVRSVLADIPGAAYCEDRDGWLNVGMALHHEFGGSDKGFEFWCEFSKRSEKFDARDQKRVWRSFKGKKKPLRMASLLVAAREARLEREFDDLGDEEDDVEFEDLGPEEDARSVRQALFDDLLGSGDETRPAPVSKREERLNKANVEAALGHVPAKVARINRKHAVAFINGKTVIITENRDDTVSYGTVGDLHNFYENDRVATDKSTVPITKQWLQHKKRREYPNGVVFAPGEEVEGAYNHWRGFTCEPSDTASCRMILSHIRKVLCQGDEASYRYLIGWLAHMIQFPGEKPGVAVVLRGLKGTGKDTLGDYVGGLFSNHHVKIASQEHLVGRFNQHQEKCLLLHVEEGFWAGNKQAESSLKHLITSEKVFIEPKGLNGFHVKSVLRLFISSNEKWVVPATEDERRYFVLDVSGEYSMRQATPAERGRYFRAIRHEMLNGGRAAFLHFLMTYDLTGFDVRDVPNTTALAEQKAQGLKNIERWWYGILQTGEPDFPVSGDRGRSSGDWTECAISADRDEFRQSYEAWMRTRKFDGDTLRPFEIGKRLLTLVPPIRVFQRGSGKARTRSYVIPSLPDCRSYFEAWLGSTVEWPDHEAVVIEDAGEDDDLL